jgi:O-antigen ligase
MKFIVAILFFLLPFIVHFIATGTLISGLWIYLVGALVAFVFVFDEVSGS